MKLKSTADATLTQVVIPNGETRNILNYFGSSGEGSTGPQAFHVQMPPGNIGRPHFHGQDQFQVFFGSPGAKFQKDPIGPVVVHYTDAYSPYGPFNSGDDADLGFFTLRAKADTITAYMPESRDRMIRKARRTLHAQVGTSGDEAALPAGATTVEPVVDPHEDGMAAFLMKAGPGTKLTGPAVSDESLGQYYCVVAGAVVQDGKVFGKKSLAWVYRDEPIPELEAGADRGFEVLVMQFPRNSLDS